MCVVYKTVRTYYLQGIRICNFGCEILVFDIRLCMFEHERACCKYGSTNANVKKFTAMLYIRVFIYSNRNRTTKQGLLFGFVFCHHKVIMCT
jgi:hypothetical protein